MIRITSRQNPRLKYLRRLHRRSFREETGRFLVEGVKFVEEALDAEWPVDVVVYAERLVQDEPGAPRLKTAQSRGITHRETTEALVNDIAT
ncbi:MAG: TrmH family RNA methyltransferase, partial [Desulfotomaculales bacterium]